MSTPDVIILGGETYRVRPVESPQLMLDMVMAHQEATGASQSMRLCAAALGLSLPRLTTTKENPIRWSDYNCNPYQYGGAVIDRLHEMGIRIDEWSSNSGDLLRDIRGRYITEHFSDKEVADAKDFSEAGEAGGS